MLGRLGLSHFALIPSGGDVAGGRSVDLSGDPGFDVRLVGQDLIVTARRSARRRGGGRRAAGLAAALDRRDAGRPSFCRACPTRCPSACGRSKRGAWSRRALRGPRGSRAVADVRRRHRATSRVAVERRAETGQPATVGNLPTMYVRVDASEQRDAARRDGRRDSASTSGCRRSIALFQQAIDQLPRAPTAIVIDLRGNPGGLAAMIMGISGHFLTERQPLGTMKTRESELKFAANPRLVNARRRARRRRLPGRSPSSSTR